MILVRIIGIILIFIKDFYIKDTNIKTLIVELLLTIMTLKQYIHCFVLIFQNKNLIFVHLDQLLI